MYRIIVFSVLCLLGSTRSLFAADSMNNIIAKMFTGNLVITVIQLLLFALAVFIYAKVMLATRRRRALPLDLVALIKDEVSAGKIESAINILTEKDTLFSDIVLPGLKIHNASHLRITAAMQSTGLRVIGTFKQRLSHIAHIGVLAPLIGLLGTFIGMTKAFAVLGAEGAEGTRSMLMAGGISEALGGTTLGLLVGIPALGGYYICLARVGRLGNELECAVEEIAAIMIENQNRDQEL